MEDLEYVLSVYLKNEPKRSFNSVSWISLKLIITITKDYQHKKEEFGKEQAKKLLEETFNEETFKRSSEQLKNLEV